MKALFIFPIFFVISLSGCGGDPCGSGNSYSHYNISNYIVEVFDSELENFPSVPSRSTTYNPEDSLAYDRLIFSLDTTIELVQIETRERYFLTFSLFPKAVACTTPLPAPGETISSIEITSNDDFGPSHPAGTSLNELVNLMYIDSSLYYLTNFTEFLDVNEYLSQEDLSAYSLMQFALNTPPEESGNHTFSIEIVFTNGKIFNLTTPEIQLTN